MSQMFSLLKADINGDFTFRNCFNGIFPVRKQILQGNVHSVYLLLFQNSITLHANIIFQKNNV